MESSYQKSAKDTLLIGITTVLVALSGLILVPFLTKGLGAHGYGIWVQVIITIGLAQSLIIFGLPYAHLRKAENRVSKRIINAEPS